MKQTDLQQFITVLAAVQKSVIQMRQTPNQNNSIDISTIPQNDDGKFYHWTEHDISYFLFVTIMTSEKKQIIFHLLRIYLTERSK